MIKIGLTEKELIDLENAGHIFEVKKGEFRFLEKNEPDVLFINIDIQNLFSKLLYSEKGVLKNE